MPPATIIIMRHGERVDHVDHTWSKTAERPHDSPLSPWGLKAARKAGEFVHDLLAQQLQREEKALSSKKDKTGDDDGDGQQSQQPESTASSSTPSHHLITNAVVMSSPLVRTVQTADRFCAGFEDRADELSSPPNTPVDVPPPAAKANSNKKGGTEASPASPASPLSSSFANKIAILSESSIIEPSFWMTHDLQRSGRFSKEKPYSGHVHENADTLKANVSPRVVAEAAREHKELFETKHHSCRSTGGFGEDVATEKRFKEASGKLIFGSPQYDDKIVVLVGHGASTTGWYNAVRHQLKMEGGDFDDSPDYTGFAVIHRGSDGVYRDLLPPFETPHLAPGK